MARRKVISTETSAAILDAEQAALAVEAYLLRQKGLSWWDIAEKLHLSENGAKDSITRGMEMAAKLVGAVSKRMLLTLEVDRLDTLMAAHWDAAVVPGTRLDHMGNTVTTPPDLKSAEFVLKVITARAKLVGLEEEQEQAARSVVIAGNSEEYVAALRLISSRPQADVVPGELVRQDQTG